MGNPFWMSLQLIGTPVRLRWLQKEGQKQASNLSHWRMGTQNSKVHNPVKNTEQQTPPIEDKIFLKYTSNGTYNSTVNTALKKINCKSCPEQQRANTPPCTRLQFQQFRSQSTSP